MILKEFIDIVSSKDGDELFEKVEGALGRIGVSMLNEDGTYKDTYALLCEIAEVLNREK